MLTFHICLTFSDFKLWELTTAVLNWFFYIFKLFHHKTIPNVYYVEMNDFTLEHLRFRTWGISLSDPHKYKYCISIKCYKKSFFERAVRDQNSTHNKPNTRCWTNFEFVHTGQQVTPSQSTYTATAIGAFQPFRSHQCRYRVCISHNYSKFVYPSHPPLPSTGDPPPLYHWAFSWNCFNTRSA